MGKQIPEFETREEEASFWQSTDLDDLANDQVEETKVRPRRRLSATFAVRFDENTVALLRDIARAQGLGVTQLVRAWVLDRLNIEREAGSLARMTTEFPRDLERRVRATIVESLLASTASAVEEALQAVLEHVDSESSQLRRTLDPD